MRNEENRTGDCFEAALKYAMENRDAKVVHAEVAGQGPLEGKTFAHAYCIDGDYAIDNSNGKNVMIPVEFYEALGRINEIGNRIEYENDEAMNHAMESGHFGPWELETEL